MTEQKSCHTFSGMPKPVRRITEKRREYQGEDKAGALVRWLNKPDDEEAKTRIKRVIALFREMYWHCKKMPAPELGSLVETRHDTPDSRKYDDLHAELNRALKYYQTTPSIGFMAVSQGGINKVAFAIHAVPVAGSAFDRNTKACARTRPKLSGGRLRTGLGDGEPKAIQLMLEVFRSGDIFKIHECRCGKYIFRRFSHQRFCSQKCRIAEYRSSEEFRVARNAKQRELYRLHKKNNIK